ncbi:MAG TPA: flagellar hook basal-body protein [Pirellulales bacterium]|nr:flagellar hook basal-body protein [Pirellulales bacterium]
MLAGLYSTAAGLNAAEMAHEVVARNLAHADVPGFRRQEASIATFESALLEANANAGAASGDLSRLGASVDVVATDFSQGGIETTGRSLDLAILGDGFFTVSGPNGPLYTKNGVFHLDAAGQLVTASGMPVEGDGGPIQVSDEASPSAIQVTVDGTVRMGGSEIGKIAIVSFEDVQQLVPVGTTLFEAPDGVTAQPSEAVVQQGAREMSNVVAVDELVNLIAAIRHYEASQRALKSIAEAVEKNISPN